MRTIRVGFLQHRTDCVRVELLQLQPLQRQRAFSLVELIIVVVIIGIIGAIAIPRISSASENAAKNAVIADTRALQHAVDLYTTEHEGVLPHVGAASAKVFYFRLIQTTDLDGTPNASGIYGPYIEGIPTNRYNGLITVRRDGAAAGANTHGWRYDTASGLVEPDHTTGTTTFKIDTSTVKEATDELIKGLGG
ncbi:MAG: prepilin-type N-terminal cleavage/methylation domain-containing protein [Phycisphaerales bacterium]